MGGCDLDNGVVKARLGPLTALLLSIAAGPLPIAAQGTTAIVGATIIDGNGGRPLADGTIVVEGTRIVDIGPRAAVAVPDEARALDGRGKFVIPGLIDTNVHMSLAFSWDETNARYWDRHEELILQGAQLQLKYGVTSVRDSYGALLPMIRVRDAIERGEVVGPRMHVAGNIVGWGGPYSRTFSWRSENELTYFQEQVNDHITLASGEELMHMTLDELRAAMNNYLDKGPDFIKYGGSSHGTYPSLIGFSPEAQQVIVEETQKRGLVAEIHTKGFEGLKLSILAGIDLIQHPDAVGYREITDELVKLIVDRGIICSMLPNKYTGEVWRNYLEEREAARKKWTELRNTRKAPLTSAEIRRMVQETGWEHPETVLGQDLEMRRRNGKKLIEAGCIVTVGADNLLFGSGGGAPEFRRELNRTDHLDPGVGTIRAIEGLVELGMTPSDALVAATRNGALAFKALDEFGTLEVGKLADLLVLSADPLADISNLRKLETIMKEGRLIDPDSLPTDAVTPDWERRRITLKKERL
ncbi:MAG: amidohydrolase family protein [Longimicrobiales bacterium]